MRPGGRTRSRGSRGRGAARVGGETKAETVPNRAGPPIPRHPPPRLFSAAQLLSRPPSPSARAHPPVLSPAAPPRPRRAAHPAQVPAATAATPLPPQPPPPPSPPRLPPPPPRLTLSRRRRKAPRLLPRVKFPGPGFTTLPCLPAAGPRERGVEEVTCGGAGRRCLQRPGGGCVLVGGAVGQGSCRGLGSHQPLTHHLRPCGLLGPRTLQSPGRMVQTGAPTKLPQSSPALGLLPGPWTNLLKMLFLSCTKFNLCSDVG